MQVYVVTNVEDGWDCVHGVFDGLEQLKKYFEEGLDMSNIDLEDGLYTSLDHITTINELEEFIQNTSYIIHEEWLTSSKIK